ncbi:MAG: hypothetical protein HC854_16765 [Flavobacterium sp.]|nr:hypothetical protein [Flavobacterium sp.]
MLPSKENSSVFETKVKRFIEDASSTNDTLRKNTLNSVYNLDLSTSDFDLISNFISNFEFKKSELAEKNNLIKQIGSIKNPKVIPFLENFIKQKTQIRKHKLIF